MLEMTISPEIVRQHADDAVMAIVFGYPDELCRSLFREAHHTELEIMCRLFNSDFLECGMEKNGCIRFVGKNLAHGWRV